MARITRVESFVFRAPIEVPIKTPFAIIPNRPALFIRIEDADGAFGWGEVWCNFPAMGAEYRARLFDALISPLLLGRDSETDPRSFWEKTDHDLHALGLQTGEPGAFAAIAAGADIALYDLASRRASMPLWRYLGGEDHSPVPVYASGLPAGATAVDKLRLCREHGFRAFKIKIGFGEKQDVSTLEAIAEMLAFDERIMADVNQGWDVTTACYMVRVLNKLPLSWIEEPLPVDRPISEWSQVKALTAAPLAGGENLLSAPALEQAIADGYLSVLQPDICKWGGLSGTLQVARKAVSAGLMYCPHFLGGGVGLLASLHLLAAIRGPGLGEIDANPNPLRENLVRGVLLLRDGAVVLPEGHGLGFEPDVSEFQELRTLHTDAQLTGFSGNRVSVHDGTWEF